MNFKLIEKIGSGAYGNVYKAIDKNSNIVCLKIINIKKDYNINYDSEYIFYKNFSSNKHNNIITIYDVFIENNKLYVVMEYINGLDLISYLENNDSKLELKECLDIILKIIDGLIFLHNNGIVHKDIKPENILIDNNKNIKIIDFGLSYYLNYKNFDKSYQTGTIYYMSPEIFNLYLMNKCNQDKKFELYKTNDIWSLGILFYILIYFKFPFCDDDDNNIKFQIIFDNVVFEKNYPDYWVKNLIKQILNKDYKCRISLNNIKKIILENII